ncbi:hypothetical protein ACFVGM_08920 [Kitasatospora purpeofusca]|uniref:hypothetical protein n=1 Tax=Kitasatospora purpeofusca TaxID=67352 RepID=UPI00369ACC73
MPSPRTAKPNPRDLTGTRKAALVKERAQEIAEAQQRLSMQSAQRRADLETPVVLGPDGRQVQDIQVVPADDAVEAPPVEIRPEWATIRVTDTLEHVTIGQGTAFSFEEGQVYRVPRHVAEHLDRLGYVWQWL